jgi:hypothetical protein
MTSKKVLSYLVLSMLAVFLLGNLVLAQVSAKDQPAPASPTGGPQTTIQGKILFMKSSGGYIVISQSPHEEYKIINENPKVLAELAQKGKPVTIEGRLPRGAYLLFIEKINGNKYQGETATK